MSRCTCRRRHGFLKPVLFLGATLMAMQGMPATPDLSAMLPRAVGGWEPAGEDGIYDAGSLYRYINGGAEVYLALNVRSVCGRRYHKPGGGEIFADLFLMGGSSDAFGAYHHDHREGEPAGIGVESEYDDGVLAFWKGSFFVSILAMEESEDSRKAVLAIGRHVAEAIAEPGSPPDLLSRLPGKGEGAKAIRYFHTHASLERYRPMGGENLLDLDAGTEGVLARYGSGDGSHVILLIRYPDRERASAAAAAFRAVPSGAGALKVLGEVVAIVTDAAPGVDAGRVLESIR